MIRTFRFLPLLALAALAGCGSDGTPQLADPDPVVPTRAFVTTTDFQTGGFATVTLNEPRTIVPADASRRLGSDPIVRVADGLVFVVNRFGGDNVQVLDPSANFATLSQCSTGNGTNPQDFVWVNSSKAYVPRLASRELLIVNPRPRPDCSDFELGRIDLSVLADEDGIPDMANAVVLGDRAYVAIQRLSQFVPAGPGALAVIDTGTDELVGEIELTGLNPSQIGVVPGEGKLVVTQAGLYGSLDGGVEYVDIATGEAEGFFVTEEALGGDVTDVVLVSPQTAYAVLSLADFTSALVRFDPGTGGSVTRILAAASIGAAELAPTGELFVADRSFMSPGLRIFDAATALEKTTTPLATGLPPFDIAFLE